jgi:hypothetical protein
MTPLETQVTRVIPHAPLFRPHFQWRAGQVCAGPSAIGVKNAADELVGG